MKCYDHSLQALVLLQCVLLTRTCVLLDMCAYSLVVPHVALVQFPVLVIMCVRSIVAFASINSYTFTFHSYFQILFLHLSDYCDCAFKLHVFTSQPCNTLIEGFFFFTPSCHFKLIVCVKNWGSWSQRQSIPPWIQPLNRHRELHHLPPFPRFLSLGTK